MVMEYVNKVQERWGDLQPEDISRENQARLDGLRETDSKTNCGYGNTKLYIMILVPVAI